MTMLDLDNWLKRRAAESAAADIKEALEYGRQITAAYLEQIQSLQLRDMQPISKQKPS